MDAVSQEVFQLNLSREEVRLLSAMMVIGHETAYGVLEGMGLKERVVPQRVALLQEANPTVKMSVEMKMANITRVAKV